MDEQHQTMKKGLMNCSAKLKSFIRFQKDNNKINNMK